MSPVTGHKVDFEMKFNHSATEITERTETKINDFYSVISVAEFIMGC